MLKTLIKKQYQECFRSYFVNPKTQKRRSKLGIAGMFLLFAFVMLFLAAMFFGMSFLIGGQLLTGGLSWLYFVLMGIMAIINIPVIIILGRPAVAALKDYAAQKAEGKNPVFKAKTVGLEGKTEYWQ